MTELEKANATIKELQQLNQELATGYDNIFLLHKIETLESYLKTAEARSLKLEKKLVYRKELIKDCIKEVLIEIAEALK